jgi:hypothetical protein
VAHNIAMKNSEVHKVGVDEHDLKYKVSFPDIFSSVNLFSNKTVRESVSDIQKLINDTKLRPVILAIPEFSKDDGTYETAVWSSRLDIGLWREAKLRYCQTLYRGDKECLNRI